MSVMTIAEALVWAQEQIGGDSPRLDAEVLLSACLGRNRTYLYTWPEKTLDPGTEPLWQSYVQRRSMGEPVAHIVGTKEFWSLELEVSPATLIPRPETETLVACVLERITPRPSAPPRLLDLGTGTGAIALALATELPDAQLVAVDNRADAVDLARRNARVLGCGNVDVLQSHWFEAVSGQFDWIVSNPPYIEPHDPHLDMGDVRFEPRSALVAEDAGLADIKFIVSASGPYLRQGGGVAIEHGWQQKDAVQQLFAQSGMIEIETVTDLAGHSRVTLGIYGAR